MQALIHPLKVKGDPEERVESERTAELLNTGDSEGSSQGRGSANIREVYDQQMVI